MQLELSRVMACFSALGSLASIAFLISTVPPFNSSLCLFHDAMFLGFFLGGPNSLDISY